MTSSSNDPGDYNTPDEEEDLPFGNTDASDEDPEDDEDAADPFGASGDDDDECDDDDLFAEELVPVGVLTGFVFAAKRNPNNKDQFIVEVQLDEPAYADCKVSLFIDTERFRNRLVQICAQLGVPWAKFGKQVGPKGGFKALKGKSALWVFTTYVKNEGDLPKSSIAWGRPNYKKDELLPSSDKYFSAEWAEWEKAHPINAAQAKVLKNSQGCLVGADADLF